MADDLYQQHHLIALHKPMEIAFRLSVWPIGSRDCHRESNVVMAGRKKDYLAREHSYGKPRYFPSNIQMDFW